MRDLAFKEKDSDFVYLSELAEFRAMSIPEQDKYIRQIDREVVWKNFMDRKYRFCFSDGKEEGRAEGIEQGRTEQLVESIKNLMFSGFDFDEVVKILKVPTDQISELRRLIFDN